MNRRGAALLYLAILLLPLISVCQDKYSKVKVHYTDVAMRNTAIDLLQIDHLFEEKGAIISEVYSGLLKKLKDNGIRYEVLVDDVAQDLRKQNLRYYASLDSKGRPTGRVAMEQSSSTLDAIISKPAAFQVKSTFGGYYSFAEMESAMNTLVATYPQIASKTSIGKTADNRDIWLIKISDNVATDETGEPEVLYMGLQHAREAITGASMIFFMQYLCEQYSADTRIKNLVDNREFYIIPCFNPDGWEYNRSLNSSGGGGWRKNRSKIDSSRQGQTYTYQYGVDLNRNWGTDWANCAGASSSCGSGTATSATETYWGSSAFSEKETQAVRTFVKSHHIIAGFDQHAFGPYYSLPFGRKGLHTMPTKGTNFYTAIPALMGTYNGMRAADSYDALGYEVAGGFKDWMLMGEVGVGTKDTVWAMTGEGGAGGGTGGSYGSFWAPASQIINLSKGMCYQNLQLAYAAGTYVDIQDGNNIKLTATSGNLSFSLKRLGLGNGAVTVTLVPIGNIKTVGAPVVVSSMLDYYGTYSGTINYTLANNVSAGAAIKYAWKVEMDGYSYSDTLVRLYNATQLLYDDMEGSFSTNWTASSNVSDNWAFTTSAAYKGTHALTESPAGNYTTSTTRTITYKTNMDLSNATAAYLSFWVKHRIENFCDKLQVQVSTNSTDGSNGTWTAINGRTTIKESGTLDGSTLDGDPSLTGIRDYWSQEVFDLSSYKSSNFRFRFKFTSDADGSSFKFEKDDGVYIDEVEVVKSLYTPSVLSARFLNFTGKLLPDETVRLDWKAIIDEQHSYFEIERSANGTDFKSLGKSNPASPFSFIDETPAPGYDYYRIKQVDKDGKPTYSQTVAIERKQGLEVKLYPNPVNDQLSLYMAGATPGIVKLNIADINGRLVFSEVKPIATGSKMTISTQQWKPSVYLLKVYTEDGSVITTCRFVKL